MESPKIDTTQGIVVFGATGRTGSAVVDHALDRGHAVTAFARHPDRIASKGPRLRIVQGDVLDREAVRRAVAGHHAVICCLGAGIKGTVRSEGTSNIIHAMKEAGVRRLIAQSSLGVGDSRSNLNAYWKYVMFGLLLRRAYDDHTLQERYVRESDLDWTIVRPAAPIDGIETNDVLHGFSPSERNLSLTISIPDLARFMVLQLEDATYLHKTPGLSYQGGRK